MREGRDGFVPNPILAGLVGICPLIAASRNLAVGVVYGIGAALCAIALAAIVPLLRSVISDRFQVPVMLALSSALALAYGFCVQIYSPAIAADLWIYLPLLTVSGLSLSTLRRSSSPSRFSPDGKSRLGAVAIESLMFFVTAAFVGALREIIGLATLTLPSPGMLPERVTIADFAPLRILVSPSGGFILLAFLIAAYRALIHTGGRNLQ